MDNILIKNILLTGEDLLPTGKLKLEEIDTPKEINHILEKQKERFTLAKRKGFAVTYELSQMAEVLEAVLTKLNRIEDRLDSYSRFSNEKLQIPRQKKNNQTPGRKQPGLHSQAANKNKGGD